jgi:hypothetical protein
MEAEPSPLGVERLAERDLGGCVLLLAAGEVLAVVLTQPDTIRRG